MRYIAKKTYIWSHELAYCVGLLASDGCLSSDNRHIDFTSKDLDLVLTYQNLICPDAKIGTKSSGTSLNTYYCVQIGNVAFYDFLIQAGLTPRKSKTISKLSIPACFYADFLRGYFDGDGTTWGFRDLRWTNSFMYYTGFVSASINFIWWLQELIAENVKTNGGTIHISKGAFTLLYAKADSRRLYEFMYYQNDLPHLARKRLKLQNFFATDPYFVL